MRKGETKPQFQSKSKGFERTSFSANVIGTLGRQLLAGLLQLGTVIIIARVYGAAVNGTYVVALLLPTMLSTAMNLGVAPANVYYLGAGLYSAREVLKTSLRLALVFSVMGLAVGGVLIIVKGDDLFPGVPVSMLVLAILVFPLSLINGFIASIFQGLQAFKEYNFALIAQPLTILFAIAGLVVAGISDVGWLIVANILGVFISLVLSIALLRRYLILDEAAPRYRLRVALRYGYKAHLSNVLAFVNYKADIFLVNLFISPVAAGIYVIAVQLSERLWLLSQAVSIVALPRLSQLSGDEEARRAMTPLLTRLTLLVTAMVALLLAAIAYPLVLLLFGEEFRDAILPLLILLPGIVAGAASRILANDIAARGRPELNMYMSVFTVSFNVSGNILLIPMYGLLGAALATAMAYSLNLVLRLFIYRRQTGISPRDVVLAKLADLAAVKMMLRPVR